MIALQGRTPQGFDVGRIVQQNAQVINMMAQQRAAERQAAQAAQTMEIQRSQEGRAAAQETRQSKEARLERLGDIGTFFRDSLASWAPFGNVAAIQQVRDLAVGLDPSLDQIIPSAQILATDQAAYDQAYQTADQLSKQRFGTATTSTVVDPNTGVVRAVNAAGRPGEIGRAHV
jgi:hypothetical protein